MTMWCYENLIFVLGLSIVLAYTFVINKYSLKRRKIERVLAIINLIMPIIVLIYYYYPVFKLDFQYNHVFNFLYPNASPMERFTSVFYSAPTLYILLITAFIGFSIRFKWNSFLGRYPFRRFLYAFTMSLATLYTTLAYPGLINKFSMPMETGSGIYPLQTNPLMMVQIILMIITVSLLLISGSIFIGVWEKKLSFLWVTGEKLYNVSMIFTVILFFMRIYYNNLFLSGIKFIEWNMLDILIGGLLVVQLFAKDSIQLSKNRVLGVLPFSSYVTVVYSILFSSYIVPKVVLGLYNAINIVSLVSALAIPTFFMSFPIGTKIFKRSFYPWMSEDPRYFIRATTSSIYIIIIAAIIWLSTVSSIYFTAGKYIHLNESYIWALLIFFLISLVISPIIQVLMKWTMNFYIFYGILFSLFGILVGAQIYKLYDFSILIFITIGIGIAALIGVLVRRGVKKFSLYNLYILVFLIFLIGFFSAYMYSEKSVTGEITSRKTLDAYGVDISYISNKAFNSSTQVLNESMKSNITSPMYKIDVLDLRIGMKNIRLFRMNYPSKDITLSQAALYPHSSYTLKLLISRYFTGQSPKISITVYRYNWFYYNYYIWPILLSIVLLFYNRDEALEED